MRNVDSKNQIWYMSEGNVTSIGFTKSFIESLDQCWQILPANMWTFKKKSPMMMVETNDALISIMAPVSGNLEHFNNIARDFPDHLTEETVIMRVVDGAGAAEAVQAGINLPPAQFNFDVGGNRVVGGDWLQDNVAAAPPRGQAPRFAQPRANGVNDLVAVAARQREAIELLQRREQERRARAQVQAIADGEF